MDQDITPGLLEELEQELDASNAGWITLVLERLEATHAREPAAKEQLLKLKHCSRLLEAAAGAMAEADWHQAGVLYRELLRPENVDPCVVIQQQPFKSPRSW